jgi:nicotinamide mononucleotide transporter
VLFWDQPAVRRGQRCSCSSSPWRLWGWWQWLRGHTADGAALRVRWLPRRARWRLLAAIVLAWPLLGSVLHHATDSDVPWWDALPTAASLAGQWLLGRKYVENWPTWLRSTLSAVALFAWKGLWLTVLLYALFLLSVWAGGPGRGWPHRAAR